jgi:hypothetical protein
MLIPSQIAKSGSEHANQAAFFAYCAVAEMVGFQKADLWASGEKIFFKATDKPVLPALHWIHAIHNQGHGDKIRGGRARAEGVKSGVADIFLPIPRRFGTWFSHGLYIEMKRPDAKPVRQSSKGGLSDDQIAFKEHCDSFDYAWTVEYGWLEGVQALKSYLS